MHYRVRILLYRGVREPSPWDTREGVQEYEFEVDLSSSLVGLGNASETALADHTEAATAEQPLGTLEGALIFVDGHGAVWASDPDDTGFDKSAYAPEIPDKREEDGRRKLSARSWRKVGKDVFLRVEPIYAAVGNWFLDSVAELPWWRRLLNKLLHRHCGNCLYFDRRTALQWRTQVTHSFEGGLSAAMWDDVTKLSAAAIAAPNFQEGEMGYCPRVERGLSATLPACGRYQKAAKA